MDSGLRKRSNIHINMVLVVVIRYNREQIKENVVFKSGNGNILQQLWGFGKRLQLKWKHLKKFVFVGQK